jgi:hypothetical protein
MAYPEMSKLSAKGPARQARTEGATGIFKNYSDVRGFTATTHGARR